MATLCQHGKKIDKFCLSDICNWKDCTGCDLCMNKYHNHMGPTLYLDENEVYSSLKRYSEDYGIKPKGRLLQQAILNYFNKAKSELTDMLDSLCKVIINEIGYPFLFHQGHLQSFKRIKKKQYKKLIPKDFKKFYESNKRLNDIVFNQQQCRLYFQSVDRANTSILQLDNIFIKFESISQSLKTNFKFQATRTKKIQELVKTIHQMKPTALKNLEQLLKSVSSQSTKINNSQTQKSSTTNKFLDLSIKSQQASQQRGRQFEKANKLQTLQQQKIKTVSIDKPFKKHKPEKKEKQLEKSSQLRRKINKSNFDSRQSEIQQHKQKLMGLMKQKELNSSQKQQLKVNNQKQVVLVSSPKKQPQLKISGQKDINNSIHQKVSNHSDSFEEEKDFQRQSEIAHTILPMQQSRKKIFDQAIEVEQKTITVTVQNNIKQKYPLSQCGSPLIIKRNQNNRSPDVIPRSNHSSPTSKVNSSPSKQNLKENQMRSLSLLIKSITMKAEQAIPHLQSALRFAENNLSAAQYLSFLFLQMNRPKDCLAVCNTILQKLEYSKQSDGLSLIINNNKTAALNMLGRYSQSIVILQKCLAIKQKDILYKNLGDAYFSIGIYQKAIYNYQKAIQLQQTNDEAHYNLSVCLFMQENYYNAKLQIEKAINLKPQNVIYKQLEMHINERIQQY